MLNQGQEESIEAGGGAVREVHRNWDNGDILQRGDTGHSLIREGNAPL